MKQLVVFVTLLGLFSVSCSSQRLGGQNFPSLSPDVEAIISNSPYKQVVAYAPQSGACFQVFAVAQTWLSALTVTGRVQDPVAELKKLESEVLRQPASFAGDENRRALIESDYKLCALQVPLYRDVVLKEMAELNLWAGNKTLAVTLARAARDAANEKKTLSIWVDGIARILALAGQKEEAIALATQQGKEDDRTKALREISLGFLVDANDCATAKEVVQSVKPQVQADIDARCTVVDSKWTEAWKKISSIPGGDSYGAKGFLSERLVKQGKGDEAVTVTLALLNAPGNYGRPDTGLIKLLAREGRFDEALKAVAKIPDYQKDRRAQPLAAIAGRMLSSGQGEAGQKILQQARDLAASNYSPESALADLAGELDETGAHNEAQTLFEDAQNKLAAKKDVTAFGTITLVAKLLGTGQRDKAAQLLKSASTQLRETSRCKSLSEIGFQFARLHDYKNARLTVAPCVASELKAGSGVDQVWRLYGDAFFVFEYLREVNAGFGQHFKAYSYNSTIGTFFKLNTPTFWDF